jgi:hypothetical protein
MRCNKGSARLGTRRALRMDGLYGIDETNGTLPSILIGPVSPGRPIRAGHPERTQPQVISGRSTLIFLKRNRFMTGNLMKIG